jgi:hypothetical protein
MVRRLTPTSSHAFMIEMVLRSIIIAVSPGCGVVQPVFVMMYRSVRGPAVGQPVVEN